MKIFYDDNNNVIGHVDGAPGYEEGIEIEGANSMVLPVDIAKKIADPTDPLEPTDIAIEDL